MTYEEEQRAQVRIPVDAEIYVRDLVSGLEIGTLANVHGEGFMVISDGGLKEDNLYQVVFEKKPGSGTQEASMGAECLWISETGTGDQIWAGFQIMEMSEQARVVVDNIMREHKD